MASQNRPRNYSISDLELSCDICSSSEIVETEQGYVCTSCGVVLEMQKLEYHLPYKEERLQHAILKTTQIGHTRERYRNKQSRKFHKLHKINLSSSKISQTEVSAKIIIKRLLENLGLPSTLKHLVFKKYTQARAEFHPGTKFRNPEKLIPGVLYFHCKINCLPIDERELLEYADIEKSEFHNFKLQAIRIMPKYYSRDRKEFILNRIMQLREEYHLGMEFYHKAQNLLMRLWEGIKCTKDDVIAGLVSSIVILCQYQYDISISSICKTLNIQMSTIQSQVKRKIFERFRVPGFQSLVRSAGLLREVMERLGLIKTEAKSIDDEMIEKNDVSQGIIGEIEEERVEEKVIIGEDENEADIVCIQTQEVMPSSTHKQFMFAVREESQSGPMFVSVKIPWSYQIEKPIKPKNEHIEFEIARYHFAKGPPAVYA